MQLYNKGIAQFVLQLLNSIRLVFGSPISLRAKNVQYLVNLEYIGLCYYIILIKLIFISKSTWIL